MEPAGFSRHRPDRAGLSSGVVLGSGVSACFCGAFRSLVQPLGAFQKDIATRDPISPMNTKEKERHDAAHIS